MMLEYEAVQWLPDLKMYMLQTAEDAKSGKGNNFRHEENVL